MLVVAVVDIVAVVEADITVDEVVVVEGGISVDVAVEVGDGPRDVRSRNRRKKKETGGGGGMLLSKRPAGKTKPDGDVKIPEAFKSPQDVEMAVCSSQDVTSMLMVMLARRRWRKGGKLLSRRRREGRKLLSRREGTAPRGPLPWLP